MTISARTHASCAATRATRRSLRRWGPCSAVRPNARAFPSSGWTAPLTLAGASSSSSSSSISAPTSATPSAPCHARTGCGVDEAESVRAGSGFWAAGHDSSHGSCGSSALQLLYLASSHSAASLQADDSGDSDGTDVATGSSNDRSGGPERASVLTRRQQQQQQWGWRRTVDAGARDTFVAGMIYALSRRILPGVPYMPGLAGAEEAQRSEGGGWKLDECLRSVTKRAGRKARRRAWDRLGEEMARAGWFDGWIHGVQTQKERIFMHPWTCLKLKPTRPHYDNRNETTHDDDDQITLFFFKLV